MKPPTLTAGLALVAALALTGCTPAGTTTPGTAPASTTTSSTTAAAASEVQAPATPTEEPVGDPVRLRTGLDDTEAPAIPGATPVTGPQEHLGTLAAGSTGGWTNAFDVYRHPVPGSELIAVIDEDSGVVVIATKPGWARVILPGTTTGGDPASGWVRTSGEGAATIDTDGAGAVIEVKAAGPSKATLSFTDGSGCRHTTTADLPTGVKASELTFSLTYLTGALPLQRWGTTAAGPDGQLLELRVGTEPQEGAITVSDGGFWIWLTSGDLFTVAK